jgi:protocatechuate 3,4-dioxygenase alpha subunit
MYFPEDDALHQTDPVLNTIEIKKRRSTLIASLRESNGSPLKIYQFNIVIQGDMETVFFDI